MSCSVEQDHTFVRLRLSPPFAVSDVVSAVRRSLAGNGASSCSRLLILVEGSQNTPAAEMRRMAELLGELRNGIGRRLAVVAPSDLSYGLFRMFGVFASTADLDVAVFRRLDEAEAWLLRHSNGR